MLPWWVLLLLHVAEGGRAGASAGLGQPASGSTRPRQPAGDALARGKGSRTDGHAARGGGGCSQRSRADTREWPGGVGIRDPRNDLPTGYVEGDGMAREVDKHGRLWYSSLENKLKEWGTRQTVTDSCKRVYHGEENDETNLRVETEFARDDKRGRTIAGSSPKRKL
jgi:hypothetical protein